MQHLQGEKGSEPQAGKKTPRPGVYEKVTHHSSSLQKCDARRPGVTLEDRMPAASGSAPPRHASLRCLWRGARAPPGLSPACLSAVPALGQARLALTLCVRTGMVLKAGGPCIALKNVKDRETGAVSTAVCGKTQDHLWYAGPVCKACYEVSARRKRKADGMTTGVAVDLEVVQEESQETLVEIEEIYGSRCARAQTTHNPAPAQPRPAPWIFPRPTTSLTCASH